MRRSSMGEEEYMGVTWVYGKGAMPGGDGIPGVVWVEKDA